jgi:hypothetical protein
MDVSCFDHVIDSSSSTGAVESFNTTYVVVVVSLLVQWKVPTYVGRTRRNGYLIHSLRLIHYQKGF